MSDLPQSSLISGLIKKHELFQMALLHHQTTRQKPISFRTMPYLVELFVDAPRVGGWDAQKGVQLGWTELMIQLLLYEAGWQNRTVAYILPTSAIRDRFVRTRIEDVVPHVPAYRDRLPGGKFGENDGAESRRLKRFGRGSLFFLGSNSAADFTEFSADCMIVDEVDHCDPHNLELARDRLRESPRPQLFRIGNPKVPGHGICGLYEESDRRKFLWKCEHCNFEQPMDWFLNFVQESKEGWELRHPSGLPICRKCGQGFHRQPDSGQWVAERPSVNRRGYHVSRLDKLDVDVFEVFHEWVKAQGFSNRLRIFFNSILGLGYEEASGKLEYSHLTRAIRDFPLPETGKVIAGMDVGSSLNLKIDLYSGGSRHAIYIDAPKTFEEAERLVLKHGVKLLVGDAKPEIHKISEFAESLRKKGVRVYLCNFVKDKVTGDSMGIKLKEDAGVVQVDRTQAFDKATDQLVAKIPTSTLPIGAQSIPNFFEQMCAPVRKLVDSASGPRYVWDEDGKPDHYRLADVYSCVAAHLMDMGASFSAVETKFGSVSMDDDEEDDDEEVIGYRRHRMLF